MNIDPPTESKSHAIGEGTQIGQFCVILKGARIGSDCNINAHVVIENDVIVGDRVTIECGVQLWDGLRVEDDVFIGPNATFTNDKHPKSTECPTPHLTTVVKKGASIGANATILPGLSIGADALVGAGAVVTQDVPPKAIVFGNPARIRGYVNTTVSPSSQNVSQTELVDVVVQGVSLHNLKNVPDLRGKLCAAEFPQEVPFIPKRLFMVYDVPDVRVRGEHAHKECHQFLVCLRGSLSVVVDDGKTRQEIALDEPSTGLYLRPGTWAIQYKYSVDSVLVVLASHGYDPDDYIRDYDSFIAWKKSQA